MSEPLIAKKQNMLTAILTNTSIGSSSTKVELSSDVTIGKRLTISNGGIKIGAGVKKIKVNAQVVWSSKTAGAKGVLFYKNTVSTENLLVRTIYNLDTDVQPTLAVVPKILDVNEGDIIYIYCSDSAGANISGSLSYVTAEVIE